MSKRQLRSAPRVTPAPKRRHSLAASVWRGIRAAAFIATHTFIALVLIGAIGLIHSALKGLGDPLLLDTLPLRYIFDVMDIAILAVFIIGGISEAREALHHDPDE